MGPPNFLRRRETFTKNSRQKKLTGARWVRQLFRTGARWVRQLFRTGARWVRQKVFDGCVCVVERLWWEGGRKKKMFFVNYTQLYTTHQLYTLKNLNFTYFYTNLPLKNDEFKKGV
jgi:hypothetical protein